MRKTCKQAFKNHATHMSILSHYSPFLLIYIPWKHQKTYRFSDRFSDVFRGYRYATPGCNGFMTFFLVFFPNDIVLLFVFLSFLTFTFWFYNLFLHFGTLQVFGKHKFRSSVIGKIGKTAFIVKFLTVANPQQKMKSIGRWK